MRSHRNKGSALVLAVIMFIVMAGIGAAFFTMAMARERTTTRAAWSDSVLHAAEAGIDDAIDRMNAYANGPVVSVPTGFPGAASVLEGTINGIPYSVEITPAYTVKREYKLRASAARKKTGKETTYSQIVGQTERRAIEAYVYPDPKLPFPDFGLFGDLSVDIGGTMFSDSYQSTVALGSYAAQATNKKVVGNKTYTYALPNGSVGSNGNVSTNGNSVVFGDATPGPNGTYSGGGYVLGATTPASSTYPLDPVTYTVPALLSTPDTFPGGDVTLGAGAYHYSSINPNGPMTLKVTGPVTLYVDGEFKMNNQQNFVIDATTNPNASVTIYQRDGDLHINGQSIVGAAAKPNAFQVYSTTNDDIQFNGSAQVYMAVYAPAATFTQNGTSDFFGALVTSKVKVTGTANFHYDEDIKTSLNSIVAYTVQSWKEFVP